MPKERKKDRIKEIMGQIEHSIQDVFQSGRLDEYLRIMGKFHRYSLNNTMLIFLQRPNATCCAGYRMWQKEAAAQSKADKEITAEGTAMAVCGFYGLDTSANSIPYLSTWSSGKHVPEMKACLNTIMETTETFITDIDRNLAQVCQERSIPVPKRLTTTKEEQLTDTDRITYPMLDPDVPEDALSAVGYRENDILPLSRDKACAMMERDMTVYVVQSGENPFMAFDREDIQTQPEGTVILHTCSMGFKSGEYGGRYTKTTLSTIS